MLNAPFFIGKNHAKLEEVVCSTYSSDFMTIICDKLKIKNVDTREEFIKFLTKVSTSYLNAVDMNSNRIQPNKQKPIFENYKSALKETQKRYRELQSHGSTSSNFHDSLRAAVQENNEAGVKEMFHPYVYYSDNEQEIQGGISITLFDNFLNVLIDAADKAPNYINTYDKANVSKDIILWWLSKIAEHWPDYTDVPFILGEWYIQKNENSDENKSGMYNSLSIDVLHDLLSSIDKKITRKNIETAMRKFKKSQ